MEMSEETENQSKKTALMKLENCSRILYHNFEKANVPLDSENSMSMTAINAIYNEIDWIQSQIKDSNSIGILKKGSNLLPDTKFNVNSADSSSNNNNDENDCNSTWFETLMTALSRSRNCIASLYEENERLSQKISKDCEAYDCKINQLEIVKEECENRLINASKEFRDERASLNVQFCELRRKLEEANNEKDAAVVRYATRERELINVTKEKDKLKRKFEELEKAYIDQTTKYKTVTAEKGLLSRSHESVKNELSAAKKEITLLKEELSCKNIEAKWKEESLCKEIETLKTSEKNMAAQMAEMEILLKSELKIEEGDVTNATGEDIDTKCVPHLLRIYRGRQIQLEEENNKLGANIADLESTILSYEKKVSDIGERMNTQHRDYETTLETLKDFERNKDRLLLVESELAKCIEEKEDWLQKRDELLQELAACQERETECLKFTEKLTSKNVTLQADYNKLLSQKNFVEEERKPLQDKLKESETRCAELSATLSDHVEKSKQEQRATKEQFEARCAKLESVIKLQEEQIAEMECLKNKYEADNKELTRKSNEVLKMTELNRIDSGRSSSLESEESVYSIDYASLSMQNTQQMLIDKLLRAQRSKDKLNERIDFLEGHVAELVAELKKKNRIVQSLLLKEQRGVMSSNEMDRNKAEISKYPGIMSSMYTSAANDSAISLELSLEINRKLQSLLEDTLLKNITLKENIETLGKEIERLMKGNHSK